MRKIIKKANSKRFLLFLFGLFSFGAQGQWNEYGGDGSYGYTEEYNDGYINGYYTGGTYVNGTNQYGVTRTKIGDGPNTWYTDSNGVVVIITHPIYSYSYSGSSSTWNPYADPYGGSTAYTGTVGSGAIGGYNPTRDGNKPLTESQFWSYRGSIPTNYIITSKNNQIIKTSDGKTHIGVLYKFQNDLTPKHTYYYFKPNSSPTLSTQLYYFFPDKIGDKATTNTGGTTSVGNLGINYTYDSTGFPRGNGYLINTVGIEIGAIISDNVSFANLESFTLPNTNIYNQEFKIEGSIGGKIFYKTENNIPIFAPIYEQLMFNSYGGLELSYLLNYYKTKININSSISGDSNIIHAELKSYLAGNGSLSPTSQEFIDWVVSVTAIQIGAVNNNFEILKAPEFSSPFAEDDDFAKVNSTDPFFTNNPDDPWRLKKYLKPDDAYVTGFVAGLGDGVIETADLAYTLVKYGVKNTPAVLLIRLVTDTDNLIKEKIEEVKIVKDLVSVVFDKTKQEQIYNSIKAAVGNWFDAATFQKTNVQAGYEHGKILFEILGALVGVTEVKELLSAGKFSASALSTINKLGTVFSNGWKLKKINNVSHLVDNLGNPISKGDDIARVVNNLADPINDGQKSLLDQFKAEVDSFADEVGDFTNKRKGNWGEMATDVKLSEKGYIPLHRRVNSIDDAGHNGIDGVFEKDGKYFIVESKYSKTGTPSLNPPTSTGLPKQMSDDWIRRPGELGNAIGDPALAEKILKTEYTRVLVTHGPNSSVSYRLVNADGSLGAVWTP